MSDTYNAKEFDTVAYMQTSGGLGCPDSNNRQAYYGGQGLPNLQFNGTTQLVGAGTDAINGSVYDPIVQSMLDDATPVKLTITDFAFGTSPSISVDIELEGDLDDISQTNLRIAILEDNLVYQNETYDNVLRDLLPDIPLMISQTGQTQSETVEFEMDPSWVARNLRIIVFLQDDATKHIYQMDTTLPPPTYAIRYYALGERTVVSEGEYTFDECALFNAGMMNDTFTVSLDTSGLPEGWDAWLTYQETDYTTLDVNLDPDNRALFNVTMDAATSGSGTVTLTFHSQSGAADDRQITYTIISADTEILLVDDDGAFDYETMYFAPAIDTTDRGYAIWDRNSSKISGSVLSNFNIVVWSCGWAFPTVDADDRAALSEYLDGGGQLFITGQDIGWEMDDIGGAAIQWYHNYLHADYVGDDTNMYTLSGVSDDPISDGVTLTIQGGDGADNQDYPSDIDPLDEYASTIFTYDENRNGAIKVDTGVYKVVYFAFGYEAIDNADDRALAMQRILDWFDAPPVGIDDIRPDPTVVALRGNFPNPFDQQTEIIFNLPKTGNVEIGVYDLQGRLVKTLVDGEQNSGSHSVVWDGTDKSGDQMASGVYYCRMVTEESSLSRKITLIR